MKSVFYLLFLVFLFGCKKDNQESPPFVDNGLNLTYSEANGFAQWQYQLNIDSTGTMHILEISHIPSVSERKKTCILLAEEVDSLRYDIEKLQAIDLQDYGFGPGKPYDYPVTVFNYRLNAFSDASEIYVPDPGEVPAELLKVLDRIYVLQNKYDHQ